MMLVSVFVIIISFFNFNNLSDSACIRAIHVVTLLVCGMGMGILLVSLLGYIRERRNGNG